jgi:hypothetical protein
MKLERVNSRALIFTPADFKHRVKEKRDNKTTYLIESVVMFQDILKFLFKRHLGREWFCRDSKQKSGYATNTTATTERH